MPAALAISIVGVPCSPRAAKTRSAAARISSRRSSAVESVRVAAMGRCEYALTHTALSSPGYFFALLRARTISTTATIMIASAPDWTASSTPFELLAVADLSALNVIDAPKKTVRHQSAVFRSTACAPYAR